MASLAKLTTDNPVSYTHLDVYKRQVSDFFRRAICRFPSWLRFVVCEAIAALVYGPLARLAALLDHCRISVRQLPLSYYRDKSFYVMRTDALDRFGTRLERRFRRDDIAAMLESAGF